MSIGPTIPLARYIVRPGDTMWGIAMRFGVPFATLVRANPQIADPSLIMVGDVINVPAAMIYTVQPGDTLWSIARRFGVSLSDLIDLNPHIANPDVISVGETVYVPFPPGF
ncbi:MAG: LysM peptidoglycan-binding domain-containing protein [Actinobacteria bacterium]|nr:LysM peptidoglycan-binding domain-containing protein [Actinomycetota bacterium]